MAKTLNITITAPAGIPESERESVANALREILFGEDGTQGFDKVREELFPALKSHGVDTDKLQELTRPRRVSECAPNAREVRLSRRLASAQSRFGVNEGSLSLKVKFRGDDHPSNGKIAVAIEVDPSFGAAINDDKSLVQDISNAVFGSCKLHPDAQSYLDAKGVDLEALGYEENVTPPTTRIGRKAAEVIQRNGLEPHQFGQINLQLFQHKPA